VNHAVSDQSRIRAAWRPLTTDLREVNDTVRTKPLHWETGAAQVLVAIPVLLPAAHCLILSVTPAIMPGLFIAVPAFAWILV
jgi:hypothetical protein